MRHFLPFRHFLGQTSSVGKTAGPSAQKALRPDGMRGARDDSLLDTEDPTQQQLIPLSQTRLRNKMDIVLGTSWRQRLGLGITARQVLPQIQEEGGIQGNTALDIPTLPVTPENRARKSDKPSTAARGLRSELNATAHVHTPTRLPAAGVMGCSGVTKDGASPRGRMSPRGNSPGGTSPPNFSWPLMRDTPTTAGEVGSSLNPCDSGSPRPKPTRATPQTVHNVLDTLLEASPQKDQSPPPPYTLEKESVDLDIATFIEDYYGNPRSLEVELDAPVQPSVRIQTYHVPKGPAILVRRQTGRKRTQFQDGSRYPLITHTTRVLAMDAYDSRGTRLSDQWYQSPRKRMGFGIKVTHSRGLAPWLDDT